MDSPSALPTAMAHPERGEKSELRGRWLTLARAAWVTIALLIVVLFVAGVPASFEYLRTTCTGTTCNGPQPTLSMVRELSRVGISLSLYAAFLLALDVAFALVCFVLSGLIIWHRPTNQTPMLGALALTTFGAATFPNVLKVLAATRPAFALPVAVAGYAGHVSFLVLFYLFPDGSFVPRWTRPLALLWAVLGLPIYFAPGTPLDPHTSPAGFVPMYFGFLGTAIFAQVYRYRRVSRQDERQRTKWVVFGFATAMFAFLVFILVGSILPPSLRENPFGFLVGNAVMYLSMLMIPVTLGIAILRYRLWDIDLIINRALVYGALTTIVAGVYVLLVGGLGTLLQARGNLLISLLGAALVALIFAPLRQRLQSGVNRLMYGHRDEPEQALSHLGRRLEAAVSPDAVLPTIVQTVKDALRLPYTAIELREDESSDMETVAAAGSPPPAPLRLPLAYHGECIGNLVVAPRAGEDSFTPADRRLLDDLVRQAGVAVHAVRLTTDLQRSRERLVTAREEERRRLRHDLHDGLGPTLASMSLQVAAVRNLVADEPEATAMLTDLKAQMQEAVADVRRLVYALRPPTLDELGLVQALREYAARYRALDGSEPARPEGMRATVDAPDSLPVLSAAVEIAAYRIALEAITNSARHAQAQWCTVRISVLGSDLQVEIIDDGVGLPPDYRAGTGMISMRERARELGGSFEMKQAPGGGTSVCARLPLGESYE